MRLSPEVAAGMRLPPFFILDKSTKVVRATSLFFPLEKFFDDGTNVTKGTLYYILQENSKCAADFRLLVLHGIFIHELYYILENVSYLCSVKLKTIELCEKQS